MVTSIRSVQDGPRITLSMLVKSPTLIPKRILDMADQQFLVDAVLRDAQDAPSGAVMYFQSTPLFTDDDPTILDEFGEIPTTNGSLGTPLVSRVVRRSFGLRVSKTMIDRNNIDIVNTQITQLRNTMIRAWEDAFFSSLIGNSQVQIMTVGVAWDQAASTIRKDVNNAKFLVKNAAADTAGKQKFGYIADTLIISWESEIDFLSSDEVSKPYVGNIADENLQYTGKLPNKFLNLDVVTSWRLTAYAPSVAIVCQRKVMGGISDERPLAATPLYPEGQGGNGGPREAWRTDVTRASAIFFDQPKAVVMIVGVEGGTGTTSLGGKTVTFQTTTALHSPRGVDANADGVIETSEL
jgi:hypothetical protein